jgi:transposase
MRRKRYSAEFKREAVKLAGQPGMVKRQVAQALGIHENLLRSWVRQFAAGKWAFSADEIDSRHGVRIWTTALRSSTADTPPPP